MRRGWYAWDMEGIRGGGRMKLIELLLLGRRNAMVGFRKPIPILGENIIGNPGFETGDPPTGWTASNASTLSRVAGARTSGGGSYLLSALRGTNDVVVGRTTTVVVGDWFHSECWVKAPNGTIGIALQGSPGGFVSVAEATDWVKVVHTGRAAATSLVLRLQLSSTTDAGLFDDAALQKLTLSSLFRTENTGSPNVDVSVPYTRGGASVVQQAGVVGRLDSAASPANFIIAHITHPAVSNNFRLEKCVGGTYTGLISATVTYVAGAPLRLVCSGTDVSAYYNGTQVGTTQTVSNAGIVDNTLHGLFSTSANVKFGKVSMA